MNDLKRITSLSVKFDKKRFYKQHIAVAMENNLFECAFELNLGLLELKISKKGKEETLCALKDIVRKVPQDQLARCLYELAVRLAKQDKLDEAKELLKEALEALDRDNEHLGEKIENELYEIELKKHPFRGIFNKSNEDDLALEF
jgi:tetratricopeptide repeat domain protein